MIVLIKDEVTYGLLKYLQFEKPPPSHFWLKNR